MKDSEHSPEGSDPFSDALSDIEGHAPTTTLRVLATTDVHMQLVGHNYMRDAPIGHHGLAGLATLIRAARKEAAQQDMPCLLVDNGDMLQGSALGDDLAQGPVTPSHPLIASMNAMRYDVIGLGNHDLDFGLTYLQRVAGLSQTPFLSTNLVLNQSSAIQTSVVVECEIPTRTGTLAEPLRVGFLSILPALTGIWNKPALRGHGQVLPAEDALRAAIPALRAEGADVVVLLAHMGIEETEAEADVRRLASLPGIDALIAGHTHLRLPGQDHAGLSDVDVNRGALGPCPATMPGFDGSDLAVLDLKLKYGTTDGWQVQDHAVQLRANGRDVPPDPEVTALCAPAHQQTRLKLAEPVGHCLHPMQNFFSLAVPTATASLIASTKRRIVTEALRDTPEANLPLLATASAHTAGGRAGPDHFLNISPGIIYRRVLAGLSPHSNAICALRVTGAELRAWLEHTLGVYTQLSTDRPDQPLSRPDRPSFHYDTIYGLTYGIDPAQPDGHRLKYVRFEGQALDDQQDFILATSQFRASGGGCGITVAEDQVISRSQITVADALLDTLKSHGTPPAGGDLPWHFACDTPVQAVLRTSHAALGHMDDIAHLSPEPMSADAHGFMRIRLNL